MDMLKTYGPHELAKMTSRDLANKGKKKEQDVLGYFKDTFEHKKKNWGICFGGYRR